MEIMNIVMYPLLKDIWRWKIRQMDANLATVRSTFWKSDSICQNCQNLKVSNNLAEIFTLWILICYVLLLIWILICYVEIKDLKPIFCSKRKSLLESWKMYHAIIKIVFRLEFCLLSPPISFFWENIISAINCQRFEKSSPLIVHGYLLWNGKGGKGSPSMRAFYFYSEKESGTLGGIENAKFWRIFFQLSWTIFILVQYEFIIPSVRIRQPWKKYVTNISHKSLQNFLIISHFIFSIFFFRTENK